MACMVRCIPAIQSSGEMIIIFINFSVIFNTWQYIILPFKDLCDLCVCVAFFMFDCDPPERTHIPFNRAMEKEKEPHTVRSANKRPKTPEHKPETSPPTLTLFYSLCYLFIALIRSHIFARISWDCMYDRSPKCLCSPNSFRLN